MEEAAAILRISRNAAYAAARQWCVTGGKSGLACIEVGRTVRLPRTELDRLLGRPAWLPHRVSTATSARKCRVGGGPAARPHRVGIGCHIEGRVGVFMSNTDRRRST